MFLSKAGKAATPMNEAELALAIAIALRSELDGRRALVKTIAKWTDASDRAINNWLAAKAVPAGIHLIALMRHSKAVLNVVLAAAGRDGIVAGL